MELIFATGNKHKKEELSSILTSYIIKTPDEIDINFDYEETGTTYFENAYGKALYLHKLTGKTVLADDSGLSVDALNGAPGIRSARYGEDISNRPLTDREKIDLLVKNMKQKKNRDASFVCCMVLLFSPNKFISVQETLDGTIAHKTSGKSGFGYDPIFFIPELNATASEISSEKKNEISHRGKAARKIRSILSEKE